MNFMDMKSGEGAETEMSRRDVAEKGSPRDWSENGNAVSKVCRTEICVGLEMDVKSWSEPFHLIRVSNQS